jgi:predicted transcriptional regulator
MDFYNIAITRSQKKIIKAIGTTLSGVNIAKISDITGMSFHKCHDIIGELESMRVLSKNRIRFKLTVLGYYLLRTKFVNKYNKKL